MHNLNPVPDSIEHLNLQLEKIKEDSVVNIYPFGSITKDENGLEVERNIEIAKNRLSFPCMSCIH